MSLSVSPDIPVVFVVDDDISVRESLEALMRAEIVYFETTGGGAVFSVGSITFCGSLWRNGWQGPVSRLLENVVRRFGAA